MSATLGPRIDYRRETRANEAMAALRDAVASGPVEASLLELVRIRVSQLNGCAFCLDLHVRAARSAGEKEQRLDVLAGWREADVFTGRERAALALAEAMTLLSGRGVPDAVVEDAEAWFDGDELALLLFAVAEINASNRLAVTAGMPVRERRG